MFFVTERRAPMTAAGFRKMIARTGESAEFPFPVHPHMLRHACGYKLANDGQDTRAVQHYLGLHAWPSDLQSQGGSLGAINLVGKRSPVAPDIS